MRVNKILFYLNLVEFTKCESSETGQVYEVLPGPAAINPDMSPTPFSNKTQITNGSYKFEVADLTPEDSEDSQDAVKSVNKEKNTGIAKAIRRGFLTQLHFYETICGIKNCITALLYWGAVFF